MIKVASMAVSSSRGKGHVKNPEQPETGNVLQSEKTKNKTKNGRHERERENIEYYIVCHILQSGASVWT